MRLLCKMLFYMLFFVKRLQNLPFIMTFIAVDISRAKYSRFDTMVVIKGL